MNLIYFVNEDEAKDNISNQKHVIDCNQAFHQTKFHMETDDLIKEQAGD